MSPPWGSVKEDKDMAKRTFKAMFVGTNTSKFRADVQVYLARTLKFVSVLHKREIEPHLSLIVTEVEMVRSARFQLTPFNEMVLEERKKSIYLKAIGSLSLVAGGVMTVSAFASNSLLLPFLLSGAEGGAERIGIGILASVIDSFLGLSGLFFVAGGVILISKGRAFGRVLVAFAGAAGIFTLIFLVGVSCVVSGSLISSFMSYPEDSIGIVLGSLIVGTEMNIQK
jgi:hypothetical protein